jgi:hypothetical protein
MTCNSMLSTSSLALSYRVGESLRFSCCLPVDGALSQLGVDTYAPECITYTAEHKSLSLAKNSYKRLKLSGQRKRKK